MQTEPNNPNSPSPSELPAVVPAALPPTTYVAPKFDDSEADTAALRPTLKIDHDKGLWICAGREEKAIGVLIVTRRWFRVLYGQEYDVNPKAPIVCASSDGLKGFGRGGRDASAKVKERTCCHAVTGRREQVCDSAAGDGRAWICRPQSQYLLLIRNPEGGTFLPALIAAKGRGVKPFEDAMDVARMESLRTAKLDRAGLPIYMFEFEAGLVKSDPHKRGYQPFFSHPTEIPDAEKEWVHNFMPICKQLWDNESARFRNLLATIKEDAAKAKQGKQDQHDEVPPDEPEKPVDYSHVPF